MRTQAATSKVQSVAINAGDGILNGDLRIPENAKGIVLFAHGSGSSRFSPRNQHVALVLQEGNLATLLLDLLTEEEEATDISTRQFRFDIDLLARRLVAATDWVLRNHRIGHMKIGYFGSSTGAAAAIKAAALRPVAVHAVVSRGGRPDLAEEALSLLKAPILLIVGGLDHPVIEMNRSALERIRAEAHIEIVPGATHLFEEPGKLDAVAILATAWFQHHLL